MRLPLLFLALSSLVVLAPPAGAAKRHHGPCARQGTHTVKATKLVRLSTRPNDEGGRDLIGCLRSAGHATVLTSSYDDHYVTSGEYDHVRVAGRFVAWQFIATDTSCKAACPPDYSNFKCSLSVRDLRRKHNVRVAGELAPDGGRLVLTRGGAIAWSDDTPYAIRAFDGGGRRTLDSGDTLDLQSLELVDGSTAHWLNGGQPKAAVLAPRG